MFTIYTNLITKTSPITPTKKKNTRSHHQFDNITSKYIKVDNHYLDCILVIHELRVNNETTANLYLWLHTLIYS